MNTIRIFDYELTSAAGMNLAELRTSLAEQKSGLRPNDFPGSFLKTWIGKVPAIDDFNWPASQQSFKSRNNALAAIGLEQGSLKASLEQVIASFGADKIGTVVGSSTSSIDRTEEAYRHLSESEELQEDFVQPLVHNPHAPGLFVSQYCGLTGPTMTINTACSSSAKVFATASRWLSAGLVDAVLVGGVDTLCLSVLHGFHSLQLVSETPCRPFDHDRDGINLGEAAGFAILVRDDYEHQGSGISLKGYGESSDAHHMSHPHPEGLGAKAAIEQALVRADLTPSDIDYINLHGTASKANDQIEGTLVASMFPETTIASSTKAWVGHTLGAAGITESIIAFDALKTGLTPGTLNLSKVDENIPISLSPDNRQASLRYSMSNSFGFGGNNCCLIFGLD